MTAPQTAFSFSGPYHISSKHLFERYNLRVFNLRGQAFKCLADSFHPDALQVAFRGAGALVP